MSELLVQNIETIFDFLEEYEDSSIFMQSIRPEHISLLRLLVKLIELDKMPEEVTDQTIKRLLVVVGRLRCTPTCTVRTQWSTTYSSSQSLSVAVGARRTC